MDGSVHRIVHLKGLIVSGAKCLKWYTEEFFFFFFFFFFFEGLYFRKILLHALLRN